MAGVVTQFLSSLSEGLVIKIAWTRKKAVYADLLPSRFTLEFVGLFRNPESATFLVLSTFTTDQIRGPATVAGYVLDAGRSQRDYGRARCFRQILDPLH